MKVVKPEIDVDWISPIGRGMELEVSTVFAGVRYPLLGIVADEEDESLWVEVQVEAKLVRVPVALLKQLFAEAEGQVHSAAWLSANEPPNGST